MQGIYFVNCTKPNGLCGHACHDLWLRLFTEGQHDYYWIFQRTQIVHAFHFWYWHSFAFTSKLCTVLITSDSGLIPYVLWGNPSPLLGQSTYVHSNALIDRLTPIWTSSVSNDWQWDDSWFWIRFGSDLVWICLLHVKSRLVLLQNLNNCWHVLHSGLASPSLLYRPKQWLWCRFVLTY